MKIKLLITAFVMISLNISNAQTGWFIQPSFTSMNLYDCKSSAVGNLHLASDNGTIFKSSNGGFNWWIYNFNDPLISNSSLKYVYGQSNDNFSAVGQGAAYCYNSGSVDSVMRITTASPIPTFEAFSYLGGVFFYNAPIAAGDGGKFYIKDTTFWRLFNDPTSMAAGRKINYCQGEIFVGDGGLIMKADSIGYFLSGGRRMRWRLIPSGTNKNLNCIIGGGGSSRYAAVGDDGTILRSHDYGETWTVTPSPVNEDLYGVSHTYAYLICGANGTILRCYDLNLDKWYKQTTPTENDLYFIYSLGYSAFISGGENGIFLRTNDGGGSLKRFITTTIIQGLWNQSTNSMIPDSLKATIRSSSPPYNVITSSTEKANASGYVMITLGPTVENSTPYYVQINHRNSIEIWSKTTQSFSGNDLYYDFYPSANRAYGDNQVKADNSPVRYALYGGDVNQDGTIDASDLSTIDNDASNFTTGYVPTDLTGDEITDATDFLIAENNSVNFVSVITP